MAALAYSHPDLFADFAASPDFAVCVDLAAIDARLVSAREMPLRSTAALGERRFTAWRGRSGRRYVASIFGVMDDHALGFTDAVLLAVSAEREVVAARDSGPFGIEAALTRWRQSVVAAGACEIHVHLLAEDGVSRRAALLDLMPEV